MHRALFIDEILRDIFDLCFKCTGETKINLLVLCRAARCCKAWKEPALDKLWGRLSCVTPLLSLIPGLSQVDGLYVCDRYDDPITVNLSSFRSYACRVKYIAHCQSIRIHPDVLSLLELPSSCGAAADILPSLTTVNISSAGCASLQPLLSISQKLTCLDLDVGFRKKSRLGQVNQNGMEDTASDLLEQVARIAPTIERISLRGRAFKGLDAALSFLTRLRVLSLRTGSSLTPEVLATVSSLPLLTELEVHTGHIEVEDLDAALPTGQYSSLGGAFFPSLQKFHVRGQTRLIEHLLGHLHPGTLHTISIESEDPEAVAWDVIFTLIASKATYTLESLTIEHHIDLDGAMPLPPHPRHPTLATLGALAPLNNLRRFIVDTSLPPDLCDADIGHLVTWWPMIEYLHLGYIEPNLDCAPKEDWRPRATLASLASFARCCPRLATLILPIDVKNFDFDKTEDICQKAMQRLTIGSRDDPSDDLVVARYLGRLFLALLEIHGTVGHEEKWKKVESALLDMREAKKEAS